MGVLDVVGTYLVPFLLVLTVLVFVHELGHYLVARYNGVRVEVFSIGFGPELWGRTDRNGTRWKFSAIPLGGYVKMLGDGDVTSSTSMSKGLTADERAESFVYKRVGQRAAIIAAGPAANFLFAFVVMAGLFAFGPHPFPPPVVGGVQEGSPAEAAGLAPGDEIRTLDGMTVRRFGEIAVLLQPSQGRPVEVGFSRDGERHSVMLTPGTATVTGVDGQPVEIYRMGVSSITGPFGAWGGISMAATETVDLTWLTLVSLGEIIAGDRGTEELGGPIRIAQLSGDVLQLGIVPIIWLVAILSINLGLINLFPVPMLDGGHLVFHAIEAVRGRPLGARAQEYSFRLGLALVLTLMVFATWNDLVQLEVFAFLSDLVS